MTTGAGDEADWLRGVAALCGHLGHTFGDPLLLVEALSHRSWCFDHPGHPSNERLEFLGDAVLGYVVAEHCFARYPDLGDGSLTKVRAGVVNASVLAGAAADLEIGPALLLGKGEDLSGGREKASILSDAFEAVLGALTLDAGIEVARRTVVACLGDRIEDAVLAPGGEDSKSLLQELSVRLGQGIPRYEVTGTGPDHARRYAATVYVAGRRLGEGEGRSKKDAERVAAEAAVAALGDES